MGQGSQHENDTHVVGERAASGQRSEDIVPRDAIASRQRTADRRLKNEQEKEGDSA
jgi:hypothetical protein